MDARRDPVLTASRIALDVAARARQYGGVGTVGRIDTHPGIATAIAATGDVTIDLRHERLETLERLAGDVLAAARGSAHEDGTELDLAPLDTTEPVAFHPELVRLTTAAATELAPGAPVLSSGALHDAAAAAAGIPTVMLFVRSIGGVSHTSVEDTSDEDLALAVRALDGLTARTLEWLAA